MALRKGFLLVLSLCLVGGRRLDVELDEEELMNQEQDQRFQSNVDQSSDLQQSQWGQESQQQNQWDKDTQSQLNQQNEQSSQLNQQNEQSSQLNPQNEQSSQLNQQNEQLNQWGSEISQQSEQNQQQTQQQNQPWNQQTYDQKPSRYTGENSTISGPGIIQIGNQDNINEPKPNPGQDQSWPGNTQNPVNPGQDQVGVDDKQNPMNPDQTVHVGVGGVPELPTGYGQSGSGSGPCIPRPMRDPPKGYERGHRGSYYKLHQTPKSWLLALATCASEGAQLVVPTSEDEAKYVGSLYRPVKDKIKGSHDKNLLFIAISDLAKEGDFHSIYGQPLKEVGYYKWQKNEPNNASKDEHCVQMNVDGLYWDGVCGKPLAFVCKIPQ